MVHLIVILFSVFVLFIYLIILCVVYNNILIVWLLDGHRSTVVFQFLAGFARYYNALFNTYIDINANMYHRILACHI